MIAFSTTYKPGFGCNVRHRFTHIRMVTRQIGFFVRPVSVFMGQHNPPRRGLFLEASIWHHRFTLEITS